MTERLRHHLPDLVLAALFCGALLYTTQPFTDGRFLSQYRTDQTLTLVFGGVYLLAKAALDLTMWLTVVVFVIVAGMIWGIRHNVMRRRWSWLIPIMILIISNVIFIGAPGFLFTGRLGEPIQDCEKFITGQTGFRIKRYPIARNADSYERQFYHKTHDGGANWEQFITVQVRAPQYMACDNIDFLDDENGVIEIDDFDGRTNQYNYLHYVTIDGGRTWQEVDES